MHGTLAAMDDAATPGALAGLRVLELGQLLAGPYAGFVLAGLSVAAPVSASSVAPPQSHRAVVDLMGKSTSLG